MLSCSCEPSKEESNSSWVVDGMFDLYIKKNNSDFSPEKSRKEVDGHLEAIFQSFRKKGTLEKSGFYIRVGVKSYRNLAYLSRIKIKSKI